MGAIVASSPHPGWGLAGKAAGALLLALVTAVLTYVATARLNVETSQQQQQWASLTQFEQSGAQMDASLSQFVDALLDKRGVAEAKSAARSAIVVHGSQVAALSDLVGSVNTDAYVKMIGHLRELTDATDGPRTAHAMAQQHVDVMAFRVEMLKRAKAQVYK